MGENHSKSSIRHKKYAPRKKSGCISFLKEKTISLSTVRLWRLCQSNRSRFEYPQPSPRFRKQPPKSRRTKSKSTAVQPLSRYNRDRSYVHRTHPKRCPKVRLPSWISVRLAGWAAPKQHRTAYIPQRPEPLPHRNAGKSWCLDRLQRRILHIQLPDHQFDFHNFCKTYSLSLHVFLDRTYA